MMDKFDEGLKKVLDGLQMAVEGYNESIAGKKSLDTQLMEIRERQTHMQETIDELQRLLLGGDPPLPA